MFGEVERMVRHHLEQREVLARLPNVVDVDESDAGLADREGIRGRARLPADHPRLERIHTRLYEEDVVAPPRDDRVSLHPRMAVLLEERKEVFTHRAVGEFLLERRIADEVVFLTRCLPACLVMPEGPEGLPALRTRLARESLFPEKLDLVFTLRHSRLDERARYKDVSRPRERSVFRPTSGRPRRHFVGFFKRRTNRFGHPDGRTPHFESRGSPEVPATFLA